MFSLGCLCILNVRTTLNNIPNIFTPVFGAVLHKVKAVAVFALRIFIILIELYHCFIIITDITVFSLESS